jgi:hypothetical protein
MKLKALTPLHKATYEGNVEAATRLIDDGLVLSVNVCTERNENALHYAMCHGQKDLIKPLVQRGINVNKLTYSGLTPVSMAVMNDHMDCLETLISVCKELNVALDLNKASVHGEQAVHHACSQHKYEALKILVDNGADVNATACDGSRPLDMASAPVQQHHHHHHHHGETCNHDHGAESAKQEEDRNKCIELLEQHGATKGEEIQPGLQGLNGPAFVGRGFSNDQTMMVHEQRFGGVLWGDYIQAFHSGKKPKVGYATEVRVVTNPAITGQKTAVLHGFIHTVAPDNKSFIATTKLTADFEDKVKGLEGEWEATLELKPGADLIPWVLTKLTPLADQTKSFDSVFALAKEVEAQQGRKFEKIPDTPDQCFILKGAEPHSHGGEHKVVVGVNVVGGREIVYHFEDGTTDTAKGNRLPYIFQQIVEQNTALLEQGKEGIFIRVDGKDVEFEVADDDDEHEHHEGCNHDHDHDHHHHHHHHHHDHEHHEGCNHDHDHHHGHHHHH